MMDALPIAIARAVHFAAAIVLFGQFVFLWTVAPDRRAPAHFARTAACSMALLLASAIAWLCLEAVAMSGLPVAEALSANTLEVVATQTLFGQVLTIRLLLIVALALVLWGARISSRVAAAVGAVLATLVLATVAGSGHAVGGRGLERVVHVCADALHLVAAGAWLGALLPLVRLLGQTDALPLASRASQRFSTLGVACMAAILLSGIVNAWHILPDLAALMSTAYGLMLLAKVLLYLLIVVMAGINRAILTPRLARGAGVAAEAMRMLRRNAIAECVLGFGIIAIVGELGITVPGPHHHHH